MMMNYQQSYPIQSNFNGYRPSSASTSYRNQQQIENNMYGEYNQQYYQQQQQQQQQQQHQYNSYYLNYDYDDIAHNTVNASDGGEAGMAGVGARRLAQKAAAQRQRAEEKRQRQLEEERIYYEQQKEEQRRREMRQRQEEQEREQRRQQQRYEQEEQERIRRRQQQKQEEDQRRQHEQERLEERQRTEQRLNNQSQSSTQKPQGYGQQMTRQRTQDSLWGQREIPADEGTYHGTALKSTKDLNNRSSDRFWQSPRSNSIGRRQHTDSQSTAKQQDYRKVNQESQNMVSDGFGGLMLQVPENKSSGQTFSGGSVSTVTNARQTVYDDDYEETEHLATHEEDDMWLKSESVVDSPERVNVPLTGDSKGVVVRQTVLEPLPKATCADCGEQLAFEELVEHECVQSACQSPLLTKGAGSISSRANSPMPERTNSGVGKSSFFDRYDRTKDENGNRNFLSPALTASSYGKSLSPQMATKNLPSDYSSSPRSVSSPFIGSDFDGSNLDEEEIKQRQERKRQIEEQRAAKKQALFLQASQKKSGNSNDSSVSAVSAPSLLPMDSHSKHKELFDKTRQHDRSHRRGAESHSSSISTVSTKSSTSSFFIKTGSGTLTPSSSNELVCSTGSLVSKPFKKNSSALTGRMTSSPSKKTIDLDGIENLMREIGSSPPPSAKNGQDKTQRTRSEKVDPKAPTTRIRRPSNPPPVKLRSRTRSGETDASETDLRDSRSTNDASDRQQRPTISRTRTQDQKKNKLCSVCLCSFKKKQPILQRDGKLFCVDDYAELFLEKCRRCHEPVRTVGVRSRDGSLTGLFHRECFSCLQCDTSFDDGTFYIFENAAYCSQHYHLLNGTTCQGCQTGIEGQCRQLTETGERFHEHCLTCQFDNGKEFCQELLHDYYIYDGKRFCEWHFEKIIEAVKRRENKSKNKSGQSADAIADAERRKARRTTYLRTVATKKGRT